MAQPSPQQWDALLQMLAADKELSSGEFLAPNGVVRTRNKWNEIAEKLNVIPGASVIRDGEQWKATWVALRGRARKRCRDLAAYRQGTGGGPDAELTGLGLSALYEKVLDITGTTAALGTKCPDPLRIQLNQLKIEEDPPAAGEDACVDNFFKFEQENPAVFTMDHVAEEPKLYIKSEDQTAFIGGNVEETQISIKCEDMECITLSDTPMKVVPTPNVFSPITLSDTPMKDVHTPKGFSPFTLSDMTLKKDFPTCRRRLVDAAIKDDMSHPNDIESLIKENAELLRKVEEVLPLLKR